MLRRIYRWFRPEPQYIEVSSATLNHVGRCIARGDWY